MIIDITGTELIPGKLFFGKNQQIVRGATKYCCKENKLNVRYKALSGFDSLDCVLVNIQTGKLKHIRKLTLRFPHFFAVLCNYLTTKVICSVFCFVCKHRIFSLLTFTACHQEKYMLK